MIQDQMITMEAKCFIVQFVVNCSTTNLDKSKTKYLIEMAEMFCCFVKSYLFLGRNNI